MVPVLRERGRGRVCAGLVCLVARGRKADQGIGCSGIFVFVEITIFGTAERSKMDVSRGDERWGRESGREEMKKKGVTESSA